MRLTVVKGLTMNAVIYIRVSTEEQAKHGYSLDSQEKQCREFAKMQGYEVIKVFADEGLSAKDLNRQSLQEMLLFCDKKKNKSNVNAIIVWKLDRLSRNTQNYQATIMPLLAKNSIKLLSTTEGNDDSVAGDLARNIYMAFAEYERKMIGLRVNAGMQAKAEQGIYPSKVPIGYKNIETKDKQKIIVIDETKAFFVRRAFELYATKTYSIKALRDKLVQEGFTCGKTPISKTKLYEILRSPFYTGVFEWQGKTYTNAKHKPIISPALFYKVQSAFEEKGNPRAQKHEFMFTGLIKHECGKYLTAEKHGNNVYYVCSGKKNGQCKTSRYIRQDELENKFIKLFESLLMPAEWTEKVQSEVRLYYKEFTQNTELSTSALTNKIPQIEKKLDTLYEDRLNGLITTEFFKRKQSEYQTEIAKIKIQIDNNLKTSKERFDFANHLIELCKSAPQLYKKASIEDKKIMLNLVCSNILIKDEKLLVELNSVFCEMAKLASILKWYPQANSNRCLHRERVLS